MLGPGAERAAVGNVAARWKDGRCWHAKLVNALVVAYASKLTVSCQAISASHPIISMVIIRPDHIGETFPERTL